MLAIVQAGFHDPEFARCFQIRLDVFVREQNVSPAEEQDAYDETALHFLASAEDGPVATARVLPLGDGAAKITRVAVLQHARGHGIGAALMRHVEKSVGARAYLLDAQIHALPFYEKLGYRVYGKVFMEAGIPHMHMRKDASAQAGPWSGPLA